MTDNNAYDQLLGHLKHTAALSQIAGLLTWDQETVMPKAAAAQRAEQCAALEAVIHARRTDPRIPEWIATIDRARCWFVPIRPVTPFMMMPTVSVFIRYSLGEKRGGGQ